MPVTEIKGFGGSLSSSDPGVLGTPIITMPWLTFVIVVVVSQNNISLN